ncbi:hypothetical protein [Trinickia mobilis]|uniref:hypothetical protein n=1 Tax=Trinickia mobilis TaxID=2816356 RepID=UPI001A8E601D|nr:hypothetical protein [Trinickia mobilis]
MKSGSTLVEANAPNIPPQLAAGAAARSGDTDEVGIRRPTPALVQEDEYLFGKLLGMSDAQRRELEERELIH